MKTKKTKRNIWPAICRRLRGRLTQVEISERLDVPAETWNRWENGVRQPSGYYKKMLMSRIEKKSSDKI